MSLLKPISFLVEKQIPEFIRSDQNNNYENFVAFVKAYYEWLETENGVTAETRNLLSYADVDKTTDEFIKYFTTKFLPYFPETLLNDKSKLIKSINNFYKKKGSTESLKFLFRILFNEDIEVLFPKENILRASDGKWRIPQTLRLTIDNTPPSFDLSTIKKRKAIGRKSKASCTIESAYRTIDVGTGAEIIEIYVSNIRKLFDNGEILDVMYVDDDGNEGILLSERIIGSLSNLKIDPKNRGLKYEVGDPVVFIGGLSTEVGVPVLEARAEVEEVTSGRIQTVGISTGGYGFGLSPITEVDIINSPGDTTGSGAVIEVDEITSNTLFKFNVDPIEDYKNIMLDAATYGMPNLSPSVTTINTVLNVAFEYESTNIGTLSKITLASPGNNYKEVPTIDVVSYYNTTNSENYYTDVFSAKLESMRGAWEATRQTFLSLGVIANVQIIQGGTGYNTATDKIYVNRNGVGYGADISFTTTSGSISSVTVVSGGEGYFGPKGSIELIVANSSNIYAASAGSGAILKAYRYGEGDSISSTVEDVGRIRKFKLLSRGSGYVSTPDVSLKIIDIGVSSINYPISPFVEEQYVYQGLISSPTFSANIDNYVTGDTTAGVIRVYNYSGALNLSSNLTITASPSYNVAPTSNIFYGNGLALADAEFLNGLIKYNGYFLNTDGFLSSDKKLQDARKYHNYSYIITTEKSLKDYKNILMDIIHPIGTKMLGSKQVREVITTRFGFS